MLIFSSQFISLKIELHVLCIEKPFFLIFYLFKIFNSQVASAHRYGKCVYVCIYHLPRGGKHFLFVPIILLPFVVFFVSSSSIPSTMMIVSSFSGNIISYLYIYLCCITYIYIFPQKKVFTSFPTWNARQILLIFL